MSAILRYVLLAIASAFLAMLLEPFFSAALTTVGVDTSELAGPFVTFVAQEWFQTIAIGVVGAAVGAWAHHLTTRFDRRRGGGQSRLPDSHLTAVIGHIYSEQGVELDGKRFVNCTFRNCTLHYNGSDFNIENPTFEGRTMLSSHEKAFWYAGLLFEMIGMLKENSIVGPIKQPQKIDSQSAPIASSPLFAPPPFKWREVRDTTFRHQTITLDGTRFIDCVFGENSTLSYDGGPTEFYNCKRDGEKVLFTSKNSSVLSALFMFENYLCPKGSRQEVTRFELPYDNIGDSQGS